MKRIAELLSGLWNKFLVFAGCIGAAYFLTIAVVAIFGEFVDHNNNVTAEYIIVLIAISALTFYKKDIINNISVVDEQR